MSVLFVANLDLSVTTEQLAQIFDTFGLVRCAVIRHKTTGTSRGFGFVEVDNEASARKACREVDGILICGKAISVLAARSQAG